MKTLQDIHNKCEEVVKAMSEKGFVTPSCNFSIKSGSPIYQVDLWVKDGEGPQIGSMGIADYLETFTAETPEDVFADAMARVSRQPDPETAALHDYMRKLGKVADQGRAAGIPDEYVIPVSLTIKAMTDNLLTSEVSS